jgi:hypothetical protein
MTVLHRGVWETDIPYPAHVAAYGAEVRPRDFFPEEVVAFRQPCQEDEKGTLYDIGLVYGDGRIEPERENMTVSLVIAYILARVNIDETAKFGKSEIDRNALFGAARIMLDHISMHCAVMSLELPCPPAEKLIFRLTSRDNPVPWG